MTSKSWRKNTGKSCHNSNICKSLVSNKKYTPISSPAFRGSCLLTPITKKQTRFPILAQYVHDIRVFAIIKTSIDKYRIGGMRNVYEI